MAEANHPTKTAFEVVTPSRVMMAADADMVVVPGADGLFGAMPRHTAMVSTLKRGVVEVHDGGKVTGRIMVDGGVADVTPERCTILAERAEMLDAGNSADMKAREKAARDAGNEAEADFLIDAIERI